MDVKTLKEGMPDKPSHWDVHNSSLAMFYARAKQTFFTPGSEYELNLPSPMLAPFHVLNGSPHPDPAVFAEVAAETNKTLEDSLRRFVAGNLSNVGTQRVLCGILTGTLFCLLGSIAPLVVNFTRSESRWLRLTAFPGLWFGLAVTFASLNGVCLGVYVFGDLRQLRKFELSRPPISKPQPLRRPPGWSNALYILPPNATRVNRSLAVPVTIEPPPPAYTGAACPVSRATSSSSSSSSGCSNSTDTSSSNSTPAQPGRIEISQAFYEEPHMDFDQVNPLSTYRFPPDTSCTSSFTATASFIHAFNAPSEEDIEKVKSYPEEHQQLSDFDFDALPYLGHKYYQTSRHLRHMSQVERTSLGEASRPSVLTGTQAKYSLKNWRRSQAPRHVDDVESHNRTETIGQLSSALKGGFHRRSPNPTDINSRSKRIRAVPMFASLTRVLSPVIVRGQWEIVVRSMCISFLICCAVLGSLLAVPIIQ